jgi:anaerobic selenocysteine-containing dehydrogenase
VLLLATDSLDHPLGMWFNPGWIMAFDQRTQPLERFVEKLPSPQSRPDLPRVADDIPVTAMSDEIREGHLRALIVNGGNPLSAFPQPDAAERDLRSLDTLVVADIVVSATVGIATHVAPTTSQLERMDFASRCVRAAIAAPVIPWAEERRPTWWLVGQLARRLGFTVLGDADVDTVTESELIQAMLDTGRHDAGDLMKAGSHGLEVPRAWGFMRRCVLPNGRWNILPDELLQRLSATPVDAPERVAPFVFINGRQMNHNNSSMYVPLTRSRDRPVASLNPADADRLGIADGDMIRIDGEDGALLVEARRVEGILPGVVTVPQGWIDVNVSELCSMSRYVDPLTGQPAFTGLPVRVERIEPTITSV